MLVLFYFSQWKWLATLRQKNTRLDRGRVSAGCRVTRATGSKIHLTVARGAASVPEALT